jgi:glyoxylase-like metal-dependent hydrolase (beta-lactamase superfamily II)
LSSGPAARLGQALFPGPSGRWGFFQREDHGAVEALRVGLFNFGVNTSFVIYRIGHTWIDAGPPNQWAKVREFAEQRPPRLLLLTHHHEEIGRDLLSQGFPIQFYRRASWGVPPRVETEPLPPLVVDEAGHRWQTIPTPGHADDMVCLFEAEQGWLFSADLYVASRVRYARPEDRLSLEIASLRRVLQLPFQTLFCSHRGPVEKGREALTRKLDYLVSLRQQVHELWQRGLPLEEIQRQLLGPEDGMGWVSGFHFSKANMIKACLQSALSEAALTPVDR